MRYSKYALKLFKLTSSLSKKFYLLSILRALTNAAKVFVGVYGLSLIIDGLVSGNLSLAFRYIIIILAFEIALRFLELTFDSFIEIERQNLLKKIQVHIADKLMNVEYKYLEDAKYLETSEKAKFAINNFQALHQFLQHVIDMINQFIICLTLISVIVMFSPLVIIAIVVSFILSFFVSKASAKKQIKLYNQLGPINQKYGYYMNVVREPKYQKDMRMYPMSKLVYNRFDHFIEDLCGYMIGFNRVIGRFQSYYSMINYAQITLIYLYIGYISITQNLGVSSYVFLTASAIKAAGAINQFMSKFVRLRENVQLLKPVFDVLDMEDAITLSKDGIECNSLESIEFRNVSFTYPGSDNEILHNVSFSIEKGEKISIVGINGAGKTTIVKLISRFFSPSKGEILWNGINIADYNYASYINQVSAVFQDFKLFALSISDNVDLENQDREHIKACLYDAGLKEKIESLPRKEETFLTKEYSDNGTEFSGGEQQKIAIARAMYKKSSLAILDEPTSALDPLSEAAIYESFDQMVKDKTTIYISHRMSSSVFCDKIIVIEEGKISDIDSHKNLMKKKKSKYFQLFNAQSTYYK